ncbi:hypothetical protein Gotur_031587 [Gossypium turneri]
MSELWALYDGLVLAWNQGFRRLESIMELINRDWRVTFSHGPREENMLADGVARMADVNIRGLQTLEECPEILK